MESIKKPEKILYENQKKIHDFIIKKVKDNFLNEIKEAYLIGSLASEKFGKYKEKYEGYLGSDIDLVVLPIKEIPENWVYEGEFHDWHKRYHGGEIEFEETIHPINFMVPLSNNFEDMIKLAKELNWKMEKIK